MKTSVAKPAHLPPLNAERDALVTLYHATLGDDWRYHTGWLTGAPLGDRHGVTTDSEGHVIELNLRHNNWTGHIPPELSSLSRLQMLSLSHNNLTGNMPSELGSLSKLNRLSLYENHLVGEISLELGRLTELGQLNLSYNG